MDIQTVRAAVEAAYAETAAGLPGWPDPHPFGQSPADEEYSRLLDPGKYRIVGARLEAWSRSLTRLGLAEATEADDPAAGWVPDAEFGALRPERAIRLQPRVPGALPLVLGMASVDGVPEASSLIGVVDPVTGEIFSVDTQPDCGCDACDSGSDELLEALDEYPTAVVSGEFVQVLAGKGSIIATADSWSAEGWSRGVEAELARARKGTSRHRVLRGPAWA